MTPIKSEQPKFKIGQSVKILDQNCYGFITGMRQPHYDIPVPPFKCEIEFMYDIKIYAGVMMYDGKASPTEYITVFERDLELYHYYDNPFNTPWVTTDKSKDIIPEKEKLVITEDCITFK